MLKNKTILVVGAAGLLGSKVINALLQANAQVIATDINLTGLQQQFDTGKNQNITLVSLDINNEAEVKRFFEQQPQLEGVVNCAYPRNKHYGKSFFDVSLSSFNDNVAMHLGSSFIIMQQSAALFLRQQSPMSIVNVSSIYGVVAPDFDIYEGTPMTMPVEYAAIKSAIVHLNKYVSSFIKDSRFRVNSISPGGLFNHQPQAFLDKYQQRTMGTGMLSADDMTGSVLFLLSDQSKYMTGQNLIIDDGFTL
ncbi:oxidoreductase [Shewanella gaetbuli]|uniref:Flagellin modification protein A n=1 Tax=Shewanella gaetbuli TaxID=220752 RepID=A0A9X1ZG31_9GAMM|nr:oxidoreductase [Shewanella gaetbuli]MCL1141719.1 flagellin modification protein A [Shewanella gaetbuli]